MAGDRAHVADASERQGRFDDTAGSDAPIVTRPTSAAQQGGQRGLSRTTGMSRLVFRWYSS